MKNKPALLSYKFTAESDINLYIYKYKYINDRFYLLEYLL